MNTESFDKWYSETYPDAPLKKGDFYYSLLQCWNHSRYSIDDKNPIELKNESDNVFTDISSEEYRIYHFGNDECLFINKPIYLSVSKCGHRILDEKGECYYIPNTWLYMKWKSKTSHPHFVK